jgi:hypothetical protein
MPQAVGIDALRDMLATRVDAPKLRAQEHADACRSGFASTFDRMMR